ncbi:MAG: Holliday junction resolvase RuvX [Microbacteriaceae bacterium]
MRRGVRVGIDVGKARVGVARSDIDGVMAVPSETLTRESALDALVTLTNDLPVFEWVVGLPLSLDGSETPSTTDAREFAANLVSRTGIPARLVDERLSTVGAQSALHAASHTTKSSRAVIDQVAATILLQQSLDAERAGTMLGETVEVP